MLSKVSSSKKKTAQYTEAEVATHNTEKSLWLIMNRKVYDVTKFHKQHPGGPAVMLQMAGRDATAAATAAHKSTLPANLMKEFVIGSVKKAGKVEEEGKEDEAGEGEEAVEGEEEVEEAEVEEVETKPKRGGSAGSGRKGSMGSAGGSVRSAASADGDMEPGELAENLEPPGDEEQGEDAGVAAKSGDQAAMGTTCEDIDADNFNELRLDDKVCKAAQDAWSTFLSMAESREAAGEAVYSALFEAAPALQSLFVSPRAVQAMKFMGGLSAFVTGLSQPAQLKIQVETLGFGHLYLDVTPPRVVIFRDAILDLLEVELGDRFTSAAHTGWRALLNYVGGAIIYVKAHYTERVNILLASWKVCTKALSVEEEAAGQAVGGDSTSAGSGEKKKNTGGWGFFGGKKETTTTGQHQAGETAEDKEGDKKDQNGSMDIPTTYNDMFLFNAAVMGFGDRIWMQEVLACFDTIVTNVSNSTRLGQECNVLSLRISKVTAAQIKLSEYKSCMLASLRSLLAKEWSSLHEVSWSWLWDNVERLVAVNLGTPRAHEACLTKLVASIDADSLYKLRAEIYSKFFLAAPAGEDYFKQSNTYLHVIADKVIAMTLDMYRDPVRSVDDISALGLRHVGYAIPTELFGPFVTACVEVVQMQPGATEMVVEAFRWSLGLVASMLVRTIIEGSTIVMKAINTNSRKQIRNAISCAPRGVRAQWMLKIQVGSQSISPLSWSIESGALNAAGAMLEDLLTIRADRDRYYFGMDDLFSRHSDIFKRLCDEAPTLLPGFLDGLIWRSRNQEAGMRRVNYYLKHLVMNEDGSFSKTLEWCGRANDPKIVCHPTLVLLSDTIWARLAARRFLYAKSWFFFTLILFTVSQSILENKKNADGSNTEAERIEIFACRVVIYGGSMTQLIFVQGGKMWKSIRQKEFITVCGFPKVPKHLEDWQNLVGALLAVVLAVMLSIEPIVHCYAHQDEGIFTEQCEEAHHLIHDYSVMGMVGMLLYYSLLLDLAVFSMKVSAFVLVCGRMLTQLGLYLLALFFVILAGSCAVSVVRHHAADFMGIHVGALTFFRMVMRMYDGHRYEHDVEEPVILIGVVIFLVITMVFLFNMLIAQLTCEYASISQDMQGFARLKRVKIIVETMLAVPKWRWERFSGSLRLDKRLEFNQGDIGLRGGVQVREPANAHRVDVDAIRRFGGSTSPTIQWPIEDASYGDEDDRFERMETLAKKAMARITKATTTDNKRGGRRAGGMSSGGGTSGGGTHTEEDHEGSDHSSGSNADEDA